MISMGDLAKVKFRPSPQFVDRFDNRLHRGSMAGMEKLSTQCTENLQKMVERGRSAQAFLTRVAYPMYQARQMRRWMTQNSSEGDQWIPLSKKYAEWKRINYAGWPGNGMRMLIRTGRLAESVIGRKITGQEVSEESSKAGPQRAAGHNVMISNTEMTIMSDVDYAKYVAEKRVTFTFKPDFAASIKRKYTTWFMRGEE
jgi:hypothetical protein